MPRSLSMSDHMSDFLLFLRGGSSAWGGDAAAQADRDLVLNLLRSVRDPGITGQRAHREVLKFIDTSESTA